MMNSRRTSSRRARKQIIGHVTSDISEILCVVNVARAWIITVYTRMDI